MTAAAATVAALLNIEPLDAIRFAVVMGLVVWISYAIICSTGRPR
jgi:hypothetical protein